MKRYLLFAGRNQYPEGGWQDFIEEASTWQHLLESTKESLFDWFHIYDAVLSELAVEKIVSGYGHIYYSTNIVPVSVSEQYYVVDGENKYGVWKECIGYYRSIHQCQPLGNPHGWFQMNHSPVPFEPMRYRELTIEELEKIMEEQNL